MPRSATFECIVCCKRAIKKITCFGCDYSCCVGCAKKYILTLDNADIKCMQCGLKWSEDFVGEAISQNFVSKKYRAHLGNSLFLEQQRLIPSTMGFVEIARQNDEYNDEIQYCKERKQRLQDKIIALNKEIQDYNIAIEMNKKKLEGELPTADENPAFMRPCMACSGFLVAKSCNDLIMSCANCGGKACIKCFATVEGDQRHVCKPEDVESVATMMQNSRPCPGCHVLIQKSEGCSQMWHQACGTTFDYNTGEIDHGFNHNPIYHEYLRSNPGMARGIIDRCVTVEELRDAVAAFPEYAFIFHVYDAVLGVQFDILPVLDAKLKKHDNKERIGRDLRILFIRGGINAEEFGDEMYKRDRQRARLTMKRDIMRTLVDGASDLLSNFIAKAKEGTDFVGLDEIVRAFETLRLYVNECLQKMHTAFKCKRQELNTFWSFA